MYLHIFDTVKGIIAVKGQVGNGHISGVPHACPCHLEPCAVFHGDVFRVPKKIFSLEHTAVQLYVPALFQR